MTIKGIRHIILFKILSFDKQSSWLEQWDKHILKIDPREPN